MTRYLPGILAMAIIVVASNILVQFTVGSWLTWGAFTYPFAFLVTEVMNRVYGPHAARRVVLAGFVVGVACSVVAAGLDKTTIRIAVGSGAAFLVAQLVDIVVFNALRNRRWWANEAVPLLGQGPITALWVSLATADWMVKMSLAILALVPFRLIVRNLLRTERTI